MARSTKVALGDDFEEFVRARQHELLRAAFLLCGDVVQAEEHTRSAFADLALHWSHLKDESPDIEVRRSLYHEPKSLRHSDAHARKVLEGLTPKDRAVAVLRHFEHRSEGETAQILGIPVGQVRTRSHLSGGVAGLLEDLAAPVAEQDFVQAAAVRADEKRRQRRRKGLAVVGVAAIVVAGAFVLPGRDGGDAQPGPGPRPSVSGSAAAEWNSNSFDLFHVTMQVGPTPDQVWSLPEIDDIVRGQLGLPPVIDFGPDTAMPTLTEIGNSSAPVRAVMLRHVDGGLRAVLFRPTMGAEPYVLVDRIPLVRNLDPDGNSSEPLEVTAIADDRRQVVFFQPNKVLVLDAFTGEVTSFAVPDSRLEQGGWSPDGLHVIAASATQRWRITPSTGAVERLAQVAYPGRYAVESGAADEMRILDFDERGATTGSQTGPRLFGGTEGATFTNDVGRLAACGFLGEAAVNGIAEVRSAGPREGVFTIDVDSARPSRLLAASGAQGESVGSCEVLGWAYNDRVLIRWNGRHLLAWNVVTGALQRVSLLPNSQDGPLAGSAGSTVALAP
ncbi:sigma factor-like helix-turn-helix DNA-binding protein [Knoellia subterranea]|uniref:RNA polymerase sigma factor 70 region 4 type 2 domain-containing protein n=1 Tax=Knoellia subterranea KCTC 19937 TaxID=1385521 RepID=A0A0A0JVA1_9MICO|nr:sigma factor-like helix-turn-helix DNA-binding protein [Knoellia subterranea]KGN39546.1 hypothetical protein N803_00465 [Knoellia subterranea KCTC 19937]